MDLTSIELALPNLQAGVLTVTLQAQITFSARAFNARVYKLNLRESAYRSGGRFCFLSIWEKAVYVDNSTPPKRGSYQRYRFL